MLIRTIKKLEYLDNLIETKRTGNAEELGEKLGVSRKQVYNYINELKDMGVEIDYDRNIKSFIYKESYEFTFNLTITKLSNNEMINLLGGKYKYNDIKSVMQLHKHNID